MKKEYMLMILIITFLTIMFLWIFKLNYDESYYERKFAQTYYQECLKEKNRNYDESSFTKDTLTLYFENVSGPYVWWINFIIIIFVVLLTMTHIINLFKSKMILNILNRTNYKREIRNLIFSSYLKSLLLLIPIVILFLVCFFCSGHFNLAYLNSQNFEYSFYDKVSQISFIIAYIISFIFFLWFCTNLGLITARKNHNIIIVVIESFLIFLGIEAIMEIGIGVLIGSILFDDLLINFNLLNILSMGHGTSFYSMIGLPFVMFLITFIIVFIKYNNKEKFILDIEKN